VYFYFPDRDGEGKLIVPGKQWDYRNGFQIWKDYCNEIGIYNEKVIRREYERRKNSSISS